MTDLDFGAFVLPEITDLPAVAAGTPLHREAGKLQRVLPPGWRVEVVAGPQRADRVGQPVLRLVMPDR
ncbi:hypothetical protein IU501_29350 [Nocardia otitidiscaviarum]|uniref:hypothetical protein n=1 Tax=Nocardia TaxID=1817 RepID=UPI0005B7CAD1|nr:MULTISPECIES: hypothetical protein [Nocardia]MBF6137089.1 hypothetical protein [Nocardia otitidiscaviarum]MBF6487988.1 hypothetical protein [Nocardia otitidiscaviarum]